MAYDIYGNNLRPGFCEVHPHVAEPYPCSICMAGHQQQQQQQQPEYDKLAEAEHYLAQANAEIERLSTERRELLSLVNEIASGYLSDVEVFDLARKTRAKFSKAYKELANE